MTQIAICVPKCLETSDTEMQKSVSIFMWFLRFCVFLFLVVFCFCVFVSGCVSRSASIRMASAILGMDPPEGNLVSQSHPSLREFGCKCIRLRSRRRTSNQRFPPRRRHRLGTHWCLGLQSKTLGLHNGTYSGGAGAAAHDRAMQPGGSGQHESTEGRKREGHQP